jgi:hypothetical protein
MFGIVLVSKILTYHISSSSLQTFSYLDNKDSFICSRNVNIPYHIKLFFITQVLNKHKSLNKHQQNLDITQIYSSK